MRAEERQLVILAGGAGSRLKELLGTIPKALAEIGGKPLLAHQLEIAVREQFGHVLILAGHGAAQIEEFCRDGAAFGLSSLRIVKDPRPLGTAGALQGANNFLSEVFAVCYGDTLFDLQIQRIYETHLRSGVDATLLTHPTDHPHDSDLLSIGPDLRISAIHRSPHSPDLLVRNIANAAFYILNRSALPTESLEGKDIARDLFPQMLSSGKSLCAFPSREYIKDIGTPERLRKAQFDFQSGRTAARSLARKVPAIFLDRDGTINDPADWISHPEQIRLLPGAALAVREINRSGRLAILATNQPVLARGECTEETMEKIHARLEWLLGREGAYLDAIYHCPHHPESGWDGERIDLKIPCDCRKPAPGMLLQGAADWGVDMKQSWMIGDSWRDIAAGKNAGVQTILLSSSEGTPPRDPEPDARFPDLASAVEFTLANPTPR